jgi:predicted Rossmann-fold nucleotide-binding protein
MKNLYGREYWDPLTGFIEKVLYEKYANIDKEDLELYKIVDSVDEAYEYVTTHVTCEA